MEEEEEKEEEKKTRKKRMMTKKWLRITYRFLRLRKDLRLKRLDVTQRLSRTFSARPYDPPSMPALAATHRTYGTTQTGSTCNTTPTHPLATVGPINKSSVTAKPGQSCRIEFTPSEHVRAPVAMLQTTGFSLPMTSEGGPKRRSWLPVLRGGRGG